MPLDCMRWCGCAGRHVLHEQGRSRGQDEGEEDGGGVHDDGDCGARVWRWLGLEDEEGRRVTRVCFFRSEERRIINSVET